MNAEEPPVRVIAWGTYDLTKPRTRILIGALTGSGIELEECHADVWTGVVDKSQVKGALGKVPLALRWGCSYAGLLARYLMLPRADAVFVGYLGQLDVLVLWPFARLRGEKIVWDAFISLFDTVVNDRQMTSRKSALAKALFGWEWLACRAADVVVLDTEAHGAFFRDEFGLEPSKVASVFVGAEAEPFSALAAPAMKRASADVPVTVLFYGQLIPLHGIATIVEAARRVDPRRFRFVFIGKGQEEDTVRAMLDEEPLEHLEWIPWIEYDELRTHMAAADVCLGIFGDSEKASRVIPNKVFQILSVGKPLITRDSPGIRELLSDNDDGVYLVPPADPDALVAALERCAADLPGLSTPLHRDVVKRFASEAIARDLRRVIDGVLATTQARTSV